MPAARMSTYRGPVCPACSAPFDLSLIEGGAHTCAKCRTTFDAVVFQPPQRSARVLQLAQSGPDGASSCANHARNAAVGNCERCGLFICSLCEIKVEGGTFCPACFDRMTKDGRLGAASTKIRAYGSLALAAGVGSLMIFPLTGIPLGLLTIYYVVKGFRQRTEATFSAVSLIVALLFGLGGLVAGIGFLVALIAPRLF
jgi:ribosomal protein L37AE/L43A